jgi:hypothetical protein
MPLGTLRPPPTFFVADPDGDGRLTTADAVMWLEQAFFLPGDWTLWAIARYAPSLAAALGIKVPQYGGLWAGTISAVLWLLALVTIGVAYGYVVAFDRRATRGMRLLNAHALRGLRVAAIRLRARFGGGKTKGGRGGAGDKLTALDTKILCELAVLEPGYASSAIDVARALSLQAGQARDLLDALQRRGLVVRTLGGGEGESGYTLSQRGRGELVQELAR